ncbi:hypothetical protein COV04_00645 [Candidatus Uhrbacteria bacterium CG10_big_fil_rev_8_21_14_0_10_48_11]|uniref:Septum formation initiator n=1 Tax=Candidatus Uhrbacteria bacterium CG10_big_fil_rev_8_21_14_0_10_48_11 TaxID=1975037 RepID=A0A2M8LFP5_9BACT|nr:MAG: hypothetical protein COV04_00645 [Candidatus Uhrbacteria bacterium CG10_big_fil_rev_8_21_14_0_10_48_11]
MKFLKLHLEKEQLWPWATGIIIALLIVGNVKLVIKRYQIQKESNALTKQTEELRNDNTDLNKLLEYVRTPAFTEEEARLRFNMTKPGEKVFVVPNGTEQATNSGDAQAPQEPTSAGASWWQLFFGHK